MVGEESIILCFSQYTIPQNFQSITYKNVINQRTFIVRNLSEIMETPCPDHKQLPMPGVHLSSVPDWKGQSRV